MSNKVKELFDKDVFFLIKVLFLVLLFFAIYARNHFTQVYFSSNVLTYESYTLIALFSSYFFISFLYEKVFRGISLFFLIATVDALALSVFVYNVPIDKNVLFLLLSLMVLSSGLFLDWSKNLCVVAFSIFILSLHAVSLTNFSSFKSLEYGINVLSLFFYGGLSFFISDFYYKNKTQIRDITKNLFRQKKINDIVFDSIESAVFAVDENKKILSSNSFAEKIFSKNKNFFDLAANSISDAKGEANLEIESQSFRVFKTPFEYDEFKNTYVFVVSDETDYKKTQRDLEQSRKLAAIGRLSSGLAHEIRNPLAGVRGTVELLKEGLVDTKDMKDKMYLRILSEVDRLNDLLTEFLDFAKPEMQSYESFNFKELLEEVVSLVSFDKRYSGVQLNTSFEDCVYSGDKSKLKQVFLNLILNAFQSFSPIKDSSQVKVIGEKKDKTYILKISDNGMGIKKENLDKIFEPFHTTKAKGTGLGLAVVHKILSKHEASISVESELDQGTVFSIEFKL